MFKRLYKSSVREKGTIGYFREKLSRCNVTADVKHFEDCKQLFMSIGKCFIVEALLEFSKWLTLSKHLCRMPQFSE